MFKIQLYGPNGDSITDAVDAEVSVSTGESISINYGLTINKSSLCVDKIKINKIEKIVILYEDK